LWERWGFLKEVRAPVRDLRNSQHDLDAYETEEGQEVNRQGPREAAGPPYLSRHSILLIAGFALGFGLLGALIGAIRSSDLSATASITLGTPAPAVFAEAGPAVDQVDLETFVESQVDVLGSPEVARRAAAVLQGGTYSPLPNEVQEASVAERVPNGSEIEISYSAEREADAIAGANAVIEGYENLMRQRWDDHHTRAIASVRETLKAAEAETQDQLASVTRRLAEGNQAPGEDGETDLTEEMLSIIAELEGIDEAVAQGATGEGLNALDVRRGILATEVDAFETVFAEQLEGSRVSVDAARLESALVREARLRDRLIELEVDSRVEGYGVAFSTPAVEAASSSAGPMLAGIAGVVLGACLGLAIVYWRQDDQDRIESPTEARRLLGYQLLSIFDSQEGGLHDSGGSTDDRHSTSQLLAHIRSQALEGEPQVLGLVGADEESRNMTAVGLASACADDGLDVLVMDGGLGDRRGGHGLETSRGLGDFVAADLPLASVIEERRTPDGSAFHVLGFGKSGLVEAARPDDLRRALDQVESTYDAVLVALPASSLSGVADDGSRHIGCVAVVTHESRVKSAARLLKEIEKSPVEYLGFIYAYDRGERSTTQPTLPADHSGSRDP
jgi:hypothetical protein